MQFPRPTHPKLMGPAKWTYFYLYVIIDIFSRRVVGWHIADTETAALFQTLCSTTPSKNMAWSPANSLCMLTAAAR